MELSGIKKTEALQEWPLAHDKLLSNKNSKSRLPTT